MASNLDMEEVAKRIGKELADAKFKEVMEDWKVKERELIYGEVFSEEDEVRMEARNLIDSI